MSGPTRPACVTDLVLDDNNLVGTLPARARRPHAVGKARPERKPRSPGEFPPELGNLSNLTILTLRGNRHGGTDPLGTRCTHQTGHPGPLLDTGVSGAIPPSLGNLSSLQRFTVGWNQLSGPIPPELGRLDNATIHELQPQPTLGNDPPGAGRSGFDRVAVGLAKRPDRDHSGSNLGDLATLEQPLPLRQPADRPDPPSQWDSCRISMCSGFIRTTSRVRYRTSSPTLRRWRSCAHTRTA